MPYFEVILEEPYQISSGPERGSYIQSHERRISFVEKFEIGRRSQLIFGKKPIELEVYNHDVAIVRVRKDTIVVFKHHGFSDSEVFETKRRNFSFLNPERFSEELGKNPRVLELREGQEFAIFKSSFCIEGKPKHQVRWSYGNEASGMLFDELAISAVEKVLKGKESDRKLLGR